MTDSIACSIPFDVAKSGTPKKEVLAKVGTEIDRLRDLGKRMILIESSDPLNPIPVTMPRFWEAVQTEALKNKDKFDTGTPIYDLSLQSLKTNADTRKSLRFTDAEIKVLRAQAEKQGKSMSDACLDSLRICKPKAKFDSDFWTEKLGSGETGFKNRQHRVNIKVTPTHLEFVKRFKLDRPSALILSFVVAVEMELDEFPLAALPKKTKTVKKTKAKKSETLAPDDDSEEADDIRADEIEAEDQEDILLIEDDGGVEDEDEE